MSDYVPDHRAGDPEEPVIGDAPPQSNTLLSNNVYDRLKQVAAVVLPALAVFYITVAPFWGLPKQEEVAGTLMAIDLLLGAVLMVLNRVFMNSDARFDGAVTVLPGDEEDTSSLRVQLDPAAILNKDEVTVRVHRAG